MGDVLTFSPEDVESDIGRRQAKTGGYDWQVQSYLK